jgi:hypothetical protein
MKVMFTLLVASNRQKEKKNDLFIHSNQQKRKKEKKLEKREWSIFLIFSH